MTKLLQFCLHHHLHHSKSNLVPAWHEDSQRCFPESLLRRQDLGDLLHHPRLHLAVVKLSPLSPPPSFEASPKTLQKVESSKFGKISLQLSYHDIQFIQLRGFIPYFEHDWDIEYLFRGWMKPIDSVKNKEWKQLCYTRNFRPERQGTKIHNT